MTTIDEAVKRLEARVNVATSPDITTVLDALSEALEVLAGADHTAAKYWRKMRDAEREMHARELHHFEEEQKSAEFAAVIERVKAYLSYGWLDDGMPGLRRILNTAPVDALRERDAALLDSLAAEMVDGVSHIDPALAWAVNLVERKANELRKEQTDGAQ